MKKKITLALTVCLAAAIPILCSADDLPKLPAEKAGQINQPTGKIAFTRDRSLWVMDWNGSNQFKVVTAENASGKISWAPDGKHVAFCRFGQVDLKGPDYLGGIHKVWDIFIGYPDSAQSMQPNTNWWKRLTFEMGGRFPEYTSDGKRIILTKDLNANTVNAQRPNYQTCFIDTSGQSLEIIRTDWKESRFMAIMPTLGPDSLYAFVLIDNVNPIGMAVSTLKKKTLNENDVQNLLLIPKATAPAWSPDGKWLAYIDNRLENQGIFLTNKSLTEKYLVYKPAIGQVLQTFPASWSPDSKWLTFAIGDGSIWIIDITGNGLRQILGPGSNEAPAWSK